MQQNNYNRFGAVSLMALLLFALLFPLVHQLEHHGHDHKKPHCDIDQTHFHSPELHWEDCQLCPVIFNSETANILFAEPMVVSFTQKDAKQIYQTPSFILFALKEIHPRGPPTLV